MARPAAAEWTQIAYIPSNQVEVYYDRGSAISDHGLTLAWFMFSYPRPVSSAEGFVFKSYKQREVIDCKQRGSFTATFTAYSEADGAGRTIYVWNAPDAVMPRLNPAVPGSVRALMDDAACAPPPKPLRLPPVPPAPASQTMMAQPASAAATGMVAPASPMPAETMPAHTPSSTMGTPGQTTATPLQ
jgi:hypothetical protein